MHLLVVANLGNGFACNLDESLYSSDGIFSDDAVSLTD